MRKKTIIALLVFIIIPVMIYVLYPTDELRIKKLIKRGAIAIEQEDLDKVMSFVSFNYRDDYGMTHLYVREAFKRLFNVYDTLDIEYEGIRISVNEKKAIAEMDVRVVVAQGADAGYLVGDAGNALHITLTLEKEKVRWQVMKTEGLPSYYF